VGVRLSGGGQLTEVRWSWLQPNEPNEREREWPEWFGLLGQREKKENQPLGKIKRD
jgi:hypothetical protein